MCIYMYMIKTIKLAFVDDVNYKLLPSLQFIRLRTHMYTVVRRTRVLSKLYYYKTPNYQEQHRLPSRNRTHRNSKRPVVLIPFLFEFFLHLYRRYVVCVYLYVHAVGIVAFYQSIRGGGGKTTEWWRLQVFFCNQFEYTRSVI